MAYRTEHDVLGNIKINADAYYGSETERARQNFPISGIRVQDEFIRAYAVLKAAAAMANIKAGKLDKKRGNAIIKAASHIADGNLMDQFVLDVFQAGAGTSTNMNLNEVIANKAIEMLHGKKGDYKLVHPNDHVNMSQSTNDTYHCVIRISSYDYIGKWLIPALENLEKSLEVKSSEFKDIYKIGRTHLQDAVPMTLGQEFSGYAGSVRHVKDELKRAIESMLELPLGGTAIGTELNTPKHYKEYAIKELDRLTGHKFYLSKNIFAAMQSEHAELEVANALDDVAIAVNRIANDIRLLGSGPRAGLNELVLPAVQPGSSIMPGKINPSMAEMLNMVCFNVMGSMHAVREAANAGQLELNVFMPVIAYNMLFSVKILSNGINAFNSLCIIGIKPNKKEIKRNLEMDTSLVTALSPYIGYSKAAEIAVKAYNEGKSIKQVCMELNIMEKGKLERILDPARQAGAGKEK
ncbi:MAG: aspartate ammonia-lyase [Candidatus Marsarchaeota archaeon]|jgi:fumarate hydratase class II|nr:aspartate ammonia-lyase [Candidatus Marsarchaeota archaeon]